MSEEWLKRRMIARDVAERRRRLIAEGMDTLWPNLCTTIGLNLTAYEKGTPGEIIEWTGPLPAAIWAKVGRRDPARNLMTSERNRLDVTPDHDRAEVAFTCTHLAKHGAIWIGLNEKDQPCFLDAEGKPITTELAAETILDWFLFPDQAGQKLVPPASETERKPQTYRPGRQDDS
jgi:hypothetical protein